MEAAESPWSKCLNRTDRQWMLLCEVAVSEAAKRRKGIRKDPKRAATRFEFKVLSPESVRGINDPQTRSRLVYLTEREAFWRLLEHGIEVVRDEHRTIGAGQVSIFRCLKLVLAQAKSETSQQHGKLSLSDWADEFTAALRNVVRQEAREASGYTRNREKLPGTDVVALKATSVSDYRTAVARAARTKLRKQLKDNSLPMVSRRVVGCDGTRQDVTVTLIPTVKPKASVRAVKHNASAFDIRKDNNGALSDADPNDEANTIEDRLLDKILAQAAPALCQLVRRELAASSRVVDQRALQIIDGFLSAHPGDLRQTSQKWTPSISVIAERYGWSDNQTQNALKSLTSKFRADWKPNPGKLACRMGMTDREQELQRLLSKPSIRSR